MEIDGFHIEVPAEYPECYVSRTFHGIPESDGDEGSFLESLAIFDISPVDVSVFASPIVQFPCDGHGQILMGNRGCTKIAPLLYTGDGAI